MAENYGFEGSMFLRPFGSKRAELERRFVQIQRIRAENRPKSKGRIWRREFLFVTLHRLREDGTEQQRQDCKGRVRRIERPGFKSEEWRIEGLRVKSEEWRVKNFLPGPKGILKRSSGIRLKRSSSNSTETELKQFVWRQERIFKAYV